MKNFSTEFTTKAKTAKSVDELLLIAKENNIELTEAEAKSYFEQLNANASVSDDDLDLVAGGCGGQDKEKSAENYSPTNLTQCPYCKAPVSRVYVKCPSCNKRLQFF